MRIFFDMDGTFVNLYGIENWLEDLQEENVRPYRDAKPLINMNVFARRLNEMKRHGFEIGVDDYVVKPFSVRELMYRISAILRRSAKNRTSDDSVMRFEGLAINHAARTVEIDGQAVSLGVRDFMVFEDDGLLEQMLEINT